LADEFGAVRPAAGALPRPEKAKALKLGPILGSFGSHPDQTRSAGAPAGVVQYWPTLATRINAQPARARHPGHARNSIARRRNKFHDLSRSCARRPARTRDTLRSTSGRLPETLPESECANDLTHCVYGSASPENAPAPWQASAQPSRCLTPESAQHRG
jgi:hypothetical protein